MASRVSLNAAKALLTGDLFNDSRTQVNDGVLVHHRQELARLVDGRVEIRCPHLVREAGHAPYQALKERLDQFAEAWVKDGRAFVRGSGGEVLPGWDGSWLCVRPDRIQSLEENTRTWIRFLEDVRAEKGLKKAAPKYYRELAKVSLLSYRDDFVGIDEEFFASVDDAAQDELSQYASIAGAAFYADLQNERLRPPRVPGFLAPWEEVEDGDRLVDELTREMSPKHILNGVPAAALARKRHRDDFLFSLQDGTGRVASVHLTWSEESTPDFPWTSIYRDLRTWMREEMYPDAEDWEE
jgi:hypothetical protein